MNKWTESRKGYIATFKCGRIMVYWEPHVDGNWRVAHGGEYSGPFRHLSLAFDFAEITAGEGAVRDGCYDVDPVKRNAPPEPEEKKQEEKKSPPDQQFEQAYKHASEQIDIDSFMHDMFGKRYHGFRTNTGTGDRSKTRQKTAEQLEEEEIEKLVQKAKMAGHQAAARARQDNRFRFGNDEELMDRAADEAQDMMEQHVYREAGMGRSQAFQKKVNDAFNFHRTKRMEEREKQDEDRRRRQREGDGQWHWGGSFEEAVDNMHRSDSQRRSPPPPPPHRETPEQEFRRRKTPWDDDEPFVDKRTEWQKKQAEEEQERRRKAAQDEQNRKDQAQQRQWEEFFSGTFGGFGRGHSGRSEGHGDGYGGGGHARPKGPSKREWREVLGFPATGPLNGADVKRRFRELALKNHPDHGGSNEKMAEIIEAYETAKNVLDIK